MRLADIVQETERERGIKCYELKEIRDAYLEAHPELDRQRGSKFLYRDARRELGRLGAIIWPDELKSNEQELKVYVIVRSSKVGRVVSLLLETPNEIASAAVCDFLDLPSTSDAASG